MNINNVKQRLQIAIDKLDKELEKHHNGEKAEGLPKQLEKFRDCFLEALNKVNNNALPSLSNRHLGIAHIIVDSWPFTSKLGELLIDAESAYKLYAKDSEASHRISNFSP